MTSATTHSAVDGPTGTGESWLSLFVNGPAGGQFSTEIDRAQNECRCVIWIHKTTKLLRIGPPATESDEYVTRIYRVVDVDSRRHIMRWQLVPDRNDEPFRLMPAFGAGNRIRQ